MNTKGIVGTIIGVVIGFLALMWVIQGNDFFMYQMFAPKYERVRRQTFEETKSYRQGMIQDLQKSQMEYITATPSQKEALASVILQRAADFPESDMPPDLRKFITSLRSERGMTKY